MISTLVLEGNEQDASFPDCKHKHMMKAELHLKKLIGVLHCRLLIEFIPKGYLSLVPGFITIFRDGVWVTYFYKFFLLETIQLPGSQEYKKSLKTQIYSILF